MMSVTGILGKKIGMTQLFDDKGEVHPVTVLQAGPCVVTQLKTLAGDGYSAAQIGLIEFVKGGKVNKPMAGHFAKNNVPPVKLMREVPVERVKASADGQNAGEELKAGDKILVDIFEDAKYVDVVGTSKGRGFAGVVRRHNFGGGPKSHGHMFQVQGSIGASSFPSRVFPGQRVTVRNLRIRGIDLDENLLMVEGAIPGPRDGYVMISKSKAPPRERRGFGGGGTVDPLKASKKASGAKPSATKKK